MLGMILIHPSFPGLLQSLNTANQRKYGVLLYSKSLLTLTKICHLQVIMLLLTSVCIRVHKT